MASGKNTTIEGTEEDYAMGQEVIMRPSGAVQIDREPVQQSQSVALMNTIHQLALKGGESSLATIERLVELHERFAAAEAKRQFDEAFARAKGKIKVVEKDAHVGYDAKGDKGPDKEKKDRTDYDYETLASIQDATAEALSENGLSYSFDLKQEISDGAMKITVGCVVTHAGGHSKRVEMFGPPEAGGNKPIHKAIASAVTIFSRLTLKAALGLASRKDTSDDDGTAADEAAVQASGPERISAEQVAELRQIAKEADAEDAFCVYAKIDALEDLLAADFQKAKGVLEAKRASYKKAGRK